MKFLSNLDPKAKVALLVIGTFILAFPIVRFFDKCDWNFQALEQESTLEGMDKMAEAEANHIDLKEKIRQDSIKRAQEAEISEKIELNNKLSKVASNLAEIAKNYGWDNVYTKFDVNGSVKLQKNFGETFTFHITSVEPKTQDNGTGVICNNCIKRIEEGYETQESFVAISGNSEVIQQMLVQYKKLVEQKLLEGMKKASRITRQPKNHEKTPFV